YETFSEFTTSDHTFVFNVTATTNNYTLSLHDALPIYGLPNTKRITNRQNHITDFIATEFKWQNWQLCQFNLDHGQIGIRISSDHLGFSTTAILQSHYNLIGLRNHVVIGQDITIWTYNYTRT